MDFDDAPDESLQQQPAPTQANTDQPISFDDAPDESQGSTPQPPSSGGGAFVRQAIRGVVPNVAGALGGLAVAGAATETGPIGMAAGAVAGSAAASSAANAAQDKILDGMVGDNPDELGGVGSKTQAEADIQQHPYWSELGQLAPAVLTFNVAGAASAAARLVNAGIMGGIDVGSQLYNKGTVDPTEAAISAGAGLALGAPRNFAAPAEEFGANVAQRIRGGGSRSQVQTGNVTGRPNVQDTPEAAADRTETNDANDITAVAIGATNDNVAQTNTEVTPTVTDPAATIAVTRNADDYAKGGPTKAPAAGVPGAPSTTIQTDGNVHSDVAAALAPKEAASTSPTHVPDQTPPPELDGLQASNAPIRRVQQGQLDQPLTPEEENSPLANAGRPGANNGLPTLHSVPMDVPPHVADIISLPQVKDAIDNGAIKNDVHVPSIAAAAAGDDATTAVDRSIPKIAVLPSGNRFEPQKALQIHEQVEKFVQSYLTQHGMPETSAFKVAHWDFAEPAEAAYYKGLGIDPQDAQSWWSRQGRGIDQSKDQTQPEGLMAKPVTEGAAPHEHYTTDATAKPTPEEQAQASILLRQPTPEGEAKPAGAGEAQTSTTAEPAAAAGGNKAPENNVPEAAQLRRPVEQARPAEVDKAIAALRAKGMDDRADQLEAMEPGQQLINSVQINKQAKNVATRQKLGNVTVRSSKDLARKQGALDATQAAFDAHPPVAGETPGDALTRAKAIVDRATKEYGGNDPIAGYKPREKPAGWQLVQAAQRAVKNPSKLNEFLAKEQTLRMEQPAAEGTEQPQTMAQLEQETKNIESGIALNKKPETADVEGARQAEAAGSTPRVTFPEVPQDTTAIAEDRQNLHDYLNLLSDDDYRKLENIYRDPTNPEAQSFERVVNTSTNPYKLQLQMESELDTSGPGQMDIINAMDQGLPVTKREKITAAAPAKPSEGAASPAKSRKDLIAEYNKKLAAGDLGIPNRQTTEERLAAEQDAQKPIDVPADERIPNIARTFASMLKDTSGALHLPLSWMTPQRGNPASPNAAPSTKEIADSLGKDLRIHLNKLSNEESKVRINANQAAARKLTPQEWEQAQNGIEDRTWGQLPNKISDAVRENWVPLRDQLKDTMDALRVEAPHLDIPPDFPGVEKSFLSRMRSGLQSFDRDQSDNDPLVHLRTLTDYAGPLQPRDFYTLTDGAGQRLVMNYDPDKSTLTIFRNGAPQIVKNVPNTFKGELGDTIGLKQAGKVTPFTVDHAKASEIENNVKQWADPNAPVGQLQPLKYLKNPVLATSNALLKAKTVLANVRMVDKLKTDQRILDNSTTDKDEAIQRKYLTEPTLLEQMRTRGGKIVYYAPQIKYALDDFAKRGFNVSSLDWLRNAGTGLAKVMYTFGPIVHALNEGSLWMAGRGFDWIKPGSWKDLATTGYDAIKSVSTQDDFQRQMRENDASLMLPNVLNRDLMRNIATKLNMEVTNKPSILDPLSKAVGTDVPTILNKAYDNSSKLMWYASDILLTQRTKELMKQGMSMPDAVAEAHKFISDYHINGTTLGSRALSQFFADPAVSLFGPYHIGIWKSYSHMAKGLITGDLNEKTKAAGQLAVMAAMAYFLYPALDSLAKRVTGDDSAEFGRRGINTIPHLAYDIAHGNTTGKDLSSISPYVATLSMPVQAAVRALGNRDFTGKQIVPTANYNPTEPEGRKNLGRAAIAEGDFAAKNLVEPYNQISSAVTHDQSSPSDAADKYFASLFGVSTKSPQAQKFLNKEPKNVNSQEKARFKRPPGMAEELYNRLVGR